jgi:hypothetical protein
MFSFPLICVLMLTSSLQKSYTGVGNPVFKSVEAQTFFTWIEGTENLTRLLNQDKMIIPSYKTSSSSPAATTSNTI